MTRSLFLDQRTIQMIACSFAQHSHMHTHTHTHTQWQAVFRHLEACHSTHSNENVCVFRSSWDRWVHICCWHLQLNELEVFVWVWVCVLDVWSTGQSPRKFPSHLIWSESPPSLYVCVCVCVLSPFWLCASATYIIEKKYNSFLFLQSCGPHFHPVIPRRVLCVLVQFVCVFPCILLHCLERKCTRTSSPPYFTHTDTRARINSAVVWVS